MCVSNIQKHEVSREVTINSLEATARWYVNIVAIWAKKLHCVQSWQIRTSTRYNVTAHTVYPRTDAKYAPFVFIDLHKQLSRAVATNNEIY